MGRNGRDKGGDDGGTALMFVVLIIAMYSCSKAEMRYRAAEQRLKQIESGGDSENRREEPIVGK